MIMYQNLSHLLENGCLESMATDVGAQGKLESGPYVPGLFTGEDLSRIRGY